MSREMDESIDKIIVSLANECIEISKFDLNSGKMLSAPKAVKEIKSAILARLMERRPSEATPQLVFGNHEMYAAFSDGFNTCRDMFTMMLKEEFGEK